MALFASSALASACHADRSAGSDEVTPATPSATAATVAVERPAHPRVPNPVSYIPPQCFAKTRGPGLHVAKNPCYVCHVDAAPPNYAADGDLQTDLLFPPAATVNPWTNLFRPPPAAAPRVDDDATLRYVRASNYFDTQGRIVLAAALAAVPPDWDADKNGRWDGFVPDVEFAFDERGFDHRPDGTSTGWRAFAYYPLPGAFLPTNGSADDVLVRLDPAFREREDGRPDRTAYEVNLAIVESLITRSSVAIDPVDEVALGVDLDLDGHLASASTVAFDDVRDGRGATRMHYVGRARLDQDAGKIAILPGLFPAGTELFHTVRYLDVRDDGVVAMAARMKEVRYARKARFLGYDELRRQAETDAREQAESPDGAHFVRYKGEQGFDNGQGWLFQGFIEDEHGALRPQSREETTACAGCHGGIGATTDATFSFARKVGSDHPARGWYHWSQHDLRGLREPKRADGRYEYTFYLEQAGAADDFRDNAEVRARFFDAKQRLVPAEIDRLHDDVSRLLVPSAERALDLDRAYRAVVSAQSFVLGRDAVLAPTQNVNENVKLGDKTGVATRIGASALRRAAGNAPRTHGAVTVGW
ncbi:MAG TPA: hypothetical protein VGM06_03370 [Polyangiaceae bacterium]